MDHNSPPRPPTPPQGARRNPEEALMAALEGCSPSDAGSIPFQQLQKMCMRVPNLSSKLTPQLRYKLYVQLLLDKNGPPQESIPSDLAQHASQANTEPASSLGEQIRMALEATDLSKEDLVAFAWFLTRSTTFRAEDADDAALVVFMANLVRHAELPGKDALRMLLNLLRSFRDYTVPARALDFAPALKCFLHLLLQYHDPELSKHLDCLCFDLAPYILHYVQRLFLLPAAPEEDAYPIVDWILILGDPAMVPYVAVAFFVSYRQALLSASTADALHAFVRDLGVRLPSEPMEPMLADGRSVALVPLHTGKSLLQNADLLLRNTPLSAQRMLEFCLDPQDGVVKRNAEELLLYYASFPCLPVERSDLQRRFSAAGSTVAIAALQYIIIDCRSTQSFNYARLPSSIGVGDVLSIDGEALTQITERLRSVKGCHMVLLGTGRALPDEINAMKVTALHLMKDGFPYVSMSSGGFHSLIPLIRGQKIIIEMAPRSQPSLAGAAQTVSTTIQHLSGMLPSMHSDDAKVKAEELASKARDSLAVAKSWGADLLSRVQTSLASTTAPNAHATAATTSGPASSSHHPSAKPEPLQGRVVGTRTTPSASAAPTPSAEDAAAAAVFTLGTEDSDDDFDLILDPVEVQSKARQPQPTPSGAPAEATSTSPDTHADIDEEFEKLFGPSA